VRVSLNGSDWQFKGFLGEDWVWRDAEKPGTRDVRWWYPAVVPGSVQADLLRLGQIPDPYYEQQSLLSEWVHQRTWIYKKSFLADLSWWGRRVTLRFEGVDYAAQFFLNGEPLGRHEGMYTPVAFEVGDRLRYGAENLLAVVIERAPDEEPQVSKTCYVRTHKARMNYWWDFCPRMVHQGIWDDVYLEVTGPVQATDLWVRPELTPDFRRADLSVSAVLDAAERCRVTAEIEIARDGAVVARHSSAHALPPGETRLNFALPLERPALWWPNGYGEQPLYEATLRLITEDGAVSHARTVTFGMRRVEAVRNEGAPEGSLPYTLVVNGRRVYLNGWNWVPIDALYGVERPAKLERLIRLADRAHVNLFRVWGGGLIEKEAFYDLCDRHGIMVWQEFILSSSGIGNKPSTDPAYVAMMAREAERIIPRRRNHPSLVIWCGGNELMDGGVPLTDAEPVLAALKDAVRRLDPDRHWLPTSPSGPVANLSLKALDENPEGLHDVHGPWEHQGLTAQYTLYNRSTALLHSEFGAEGMANVKTIEATIAPEHRWPATKDNPVYFHRGAWWINEPLVQKAFGGIEDWVTLSRASQFLQHEALRYALEANRRRQWRCSGSIPWQFNEPFPNAWCTSAVDYYGEPKGGYWAVARAYAPLAVTARFDSQVWAGRERFTAQVWLAHAGAQALDGLTVKVRVVGATGRVYREQECAATAPAAGAVPICTVDLPLAEIREPLFFLDLTVTGSPDLTATGGSDMAVSGGARRVAENRYLFATGENLRPMLHQPTVAVEVAAGADGQLTLTNRGAVAALCVRLDDARPLNAPGWAWFSDNLLHLLPGERRTVRVEWSPEAGPERRLLIQGWNTEAIRHG